MELFWMISNVLLWSYSCASIDLISFMHEQSHTFFFKLFFFFNL